MRPCMALSYLQSKKFNNSWIKLQLIDVRNVIGIGFEWNGISIV